MLRLIDADPWTVLFWRGLLSGMVVTFGLAVLYRSKTAGHFREIGSKGLWLAALFAAGTVLFRHLDYPDQGRQHPVHRLNGAAVRRHYRPAVPERSRAGAGLGCHWPGSVRHRRDRLWQPGGRQRLRAGRSGGARLCVFDRRDVLAGAQPAREQHGSGDGAGRFPDRTCRTAAGRTVRGGPGKLALPGHHGPGAAARVQPDDAGSALMFRRPKSVCCCCSKPCSARFGSGWRWAKRRALPGWSAALSSSGRWCC